MSQLRPFYEDVRAHYDLSNDFFALFLDPTMTYSCGFYERDDSTLEEAQIAKLDMALRKADIQSGHKVLDIGCGWGSAMRRAAEEYGANVTGLTLSQEQHDYVRKSLKDKPLSRGSVDLHIKGWEEFDEPVDRIYSIEVFEHFRKERYPAFFNRCREMMADDGQMFLQTSLWYGDESLKKKGLAVEHEHILFAKFIGRIIFPGGQLCEPDEVVEQAEAAGFTVPEVLSLRDHYPRTLDTWAGNLEAQRERAIELTSEEVYNNYMHYLTGCAKYFRTGHIDVMQFTLRK